MLSVYSRPVNEFSSWSPVWLTGCVASASWLISSHWVFFTFQNDVLSDAGEKSLKFTECFPFCKVFFSRHYLIQFLLMFVYYNTHQIQHTPYTTHTTYHTHHTQHTTHPSHNTHTTHCIQHTPHTTHCIQHIPHTTHNTQHIQHTPHTPQTTHTTNKTYHTHHTQQSTLSSFWSGCPLKILCVEGLVTSLWCYWEVAGPLGGVGSSGYTGTPAFPYGSQSPEGDQAAFTMRSTRMYCATKWPWGETLGPEAK